MPVPALIRAAKPTTDQHPDPSRRRTQSSGRPSSMDSTYTQASTCTRTASFGSSPGARPCLTAPVTSPLMTQKWYATAVGGLLPTSMKIMSNTRFSDLIPRRN